MDLYEALKQGLTEEELLKNFNKELAEAKDKFSKEATRSRNLELARRDLIDSILDYVEIVTDLPFETEAERQESFKVLEQCIEEYEKLDFSKTAKNFFTFKYKPKDDDLDIIDKFIRSLK